VHEQNLPASAKGRQYAARAPQSQLLFRYAFMARGHMGRNIKINSWLRLMGKDLRLFHA
jgi:hypothetical protein